MRRHQGQEVTSTGVQLGRVGELTLLGLCGRRYASRMNRGTYRGRTSTEHTEVQPRQRQPPPQESKARDTAYHPASHKAAAVELVQRFQAGQAKGRHGSRQGR